MHKTLIIKSDGGARGNPGPAAIGVVIEEGHKVIHTISRFIGQASNNVAEYSAVIAGLEYAKSMGAERVICYLDSKLVVEQLNQRYKVKHPDMGKLFLVAWNLIQCFDKVHFHYIPREHNTQADCLVNKALDAELKK